MIRPRDYVLLEYPIHGCQVARVESLSGGNVLVSVNVHGVHCGEVVADGSVTLLCGGPACLHPAAAFTPAGDPLCEACSARSEVAVLAVRPEVPPPLVACVCGASLDEAKSDGQHTMGAPPIMCEYRTCEHCQSTRAYMPPDIVSGVPVHLFSSPGALVYEDERVGLLDALFDLEPCGELAELRRGRTVVARALIGVGGVYGWRVLPPER